MRKSLKKFFLYTMLTFAGLLIAAALLPYVFREDLKEAIKKMANDNINAVVDFKDADLSFIRSFPDILISVDSLSVMGTDDFEGIMLYKAFKTQVDVSLLSLISKNAIPEINSIVCIKPEINILKVNDTLANYLITKDNGSESAAYHLKLDYYKLEDGSITYQDKSSNMFFAATGILHEGQGDFTRDVFDLDTKTTTNSLFFANAGITYIKNATANLDAKININFPEDKYTLKDNILKINELDFTGDGFIQFKEDDIVINANFASASEEFKSFLSVVPYAYTKDYNQVKTSGKAGFKGFVNGIYNDKKKLMPAFDISVQVTDGYVKYPGVPQDIKNIFANINIKAARPDYKDMTLNMSDFRLKIGNDPISGSIFASNLSADQKVEGHIKGKINLSSLASSLPISDIEHMEGNVACDLIFKAKMSDINHENYNAIEFKGSADATNIRYKSKDSPDIKIIQASAEASPEQITFHGDNIQLGKSKLNLDAKVKNPLAVFSTEKNINVDVNGRSDFIDLDEWNTGGQANQSVPHEPLGPSPVSDEILRNASVHIAFKSGKILYSNHTITNLNILTDMAANAIKLQYLTASLGDNDIRLSGVVLNAWDYLFNGGVLDGNISFTSNKFDANTFMTAVPKDANARPASNEVIQVPANVRIKLAADIKDLTYTNLNLKNFKGDLEVADQEVTIKNMETNTLGGVIGLQGLYNSKDITRPDFSVKLDLSKIKFVEAISKFEMLAKAAPIASYIDGFFNSTLIMKGSLLSGMTPDLSSLDASGFIETVNGELKGYNPLNELGEKLGISELKNLNLTNTKNWFEIINGFIELKEYKKNIKGIDMTIAGKTQIGLGMDYNIDLVIPRTMLQKNKWASVVEAGWGNIEKEASKLGINIQQGPNIFLTVKMTGNLKNPKFTITPKSSKDGSVGNVIQNKVDETVSEIKDSINKEIKKKEAQIKDTLTQIADKELEKIKSKAEEAANKAVDSLKSKIKDEVTTKLDSLTKGAVSDSLRKKAEEILNKKTTEEVDKIKEKLKDFNPFKKKGNG